VCAKGMQHLGMAPVPLRANGFAAEANRAAPLSSAVLLKVITCDVDGNASRRPYVPVDPSHVRAFTTGVVDSIYESAESPWDRYGLHIGSTRTET
jgi:hypothetical protein